MTDTAAIDFDKIRKLFGGRLTQGQVDGINTILDGWNKYGDGNRQRLAYVLATAFHETARTMQPIAEFGKGKGKKYGKIDQTGKAPYGRGHVQLTWRDNYVRADKELGLGGRLAANYDLALDPAISVRVLIAGCLKGWFTGKDLDDFIDGVDESDAEDAREYAAARKVVNGTDRAQLIADYAIVFERALTDGPVKELPKNEHIEPDVSKPPTRAESGGWLAALIAIIVDLIKRFRK